MSKVTRELPIWKRSEQPIARSYRGEIIVGLIGLVGVVVTATLSNWDKISPPDGTVSAAYRGYRPTGDIGVEIRYFMEVSGLRDSVARIQRNALVEARSEIARAGTIPPSVLDSAFEAVSLELKGEYDTFVASYVPVAAKRISLEQIQELNKFYSTERMRSYIAVQPLLIDDLTPIATAQAKAGAERVAVRLKEKLSRFAIPGLPGSASAPKK